MRIALLGDIALIGRYDRTVSPDVSKRVSAVRDITRSCDYVIGNLETPFTQKNTTRACKGVYLKSDPVNVDTLKEMGVTHVSLANNHLFDYGMRGAEETCQTLKSAGIESVGLCNPPAELSADGERALVDGFCCLSANALGYGERSGRVQMLNDRMITRFLQRSQEKNCFPIISAHFGLEGLHFPAREHIGFFRKYANEFPLILHGNHPHAIQGYEQVNQSLLIYAQGNLCFDEVSTTSINSIPKEQPEERKTYISVVEIQNGMIASHDVFPLSDLSREGLETNNSISEELDYYCEALKRPLPEIEEMRRQEQKQQKDAAQKRDLKFYTDRLNYRYVGAFLNGKKHAKAYRKSFCEYMKD